MLVKDFMTKDVITVREDQSMLEAREVMRSKKLYSLPVVDDISRVRGMITVDDIGKASPSDSSTLSRYEANYLLGRLKVKDVMSRTVVTVDSEDTIEYVAYNLYKRKVNALPVLGRDGKLCGIISRSDMFRSFVEMMGVNQSCTRFTVITPDKVGVVAEITNIMKEDGINIISLATLQTGNGTAEITIRCRLNNNGLDIIEQIREAGYEDKNMELIAVKELLPLTGYIRGGCSPVGMKKKFPTYLDETCILWEEIAVSAGARGHQLILNPEALARLVSAELADIIV